MKKILSFYLMVLLALASSGALRAAQTGPFEGAWEVCEFFEGSQYCESYVLLQRGQNICGTWEYMASRQVYGGQLQATALSARTARKDLVCGRPGSEARTECSDPDTPQVTWEPAHGFLYRGKGGLSESPQMRASFPRRAFQKGERAELLAQPWIADCLSRPEQ